MQDMHSYISEVLAAALELALTGHLRMYAALAAVKERLGREVPLERYWSDVYRRFCGGLYRTVIEPNRSLRSRCALATATPAARCRYAVRPLHEPHGAAHRCMH